MIHIMMDILDLQTCVKKYIYNTQNSQSSSMVLVSIANKAQ